MLPSTINGNRHVDSVLRNYQVARGEGTPVFEAGERLRGLIGQWYSGRLESVHNSGSFAKGTSIRGGTDLDLFISLKSRTNGSLRRIFDGLNSHVESVGLRVRRQNVSIGVELNDVKVDLVPGRKHKNSDDHSLYSSRGDTWIKTNVVKHIELIRSSGRTAAIRATKICRRNRGLDFPSFYVELVVLRALQGRSASGSGEELSQVLRFLATNFVGAQFVDPANRSNVISGSLSSNVKNQIARQAARPFVRLKKAPGTGLFGETNGWHAPTTGTVQGEASGDGRQVVGESRHRSPNRKG